VAHLAVAWGDHQNFLNATFAQTVKSVSVGSARHIIGWDPSEKRVRSWIFDETGGFGEGSWTQDGKQWTIKTKSVLQDGKKATMTVSLTIVDPDTITLQAKDRTVDDKPTGETREVTLKRMK
jgi:hypothetical protein